jgi:hypothetical protein
MDLRGFINMLDILSDGPSYKPHKYLLLLAVLDILQKAPENKIYFDENLKSYFTKYFKQYKRKGIGTDLIHPIITS